MVGAYCKMVTLSCSKYGLELEKWKIPNPCLAFKEGSLGTRTCIKRKKIDYGKFFDFCAEKCVYN